MNIYGASTVARLCPGCWGYSSERDRHKTPAQLWTAYIPGRPDRQNPTGVCQVYVMAGGGKCDGRKRRLDSKGGGGVGGCAEAGGLLLWVPGQGRPHRADAYGSEEPPAQRGAHAGRAVGKDCNPHTHLLAGSGTWHP